MKIKGLILAALFVFGGISMTSCNRGYGCPTWSMNDTTVKVVTQAAVGLFQLR